MHLAGRVWDPNMRAHDPHGAFTVTITDGEHPVTKGLGSFETTGRVVHLPGGRDTDSLAGDRPLEGGQLRLPDGLRPRIRQRWQGLPRALGHDVAAIENPAAAELFDEAAPGPPDWTLSAKPGENTHTSSGHIT